MYKSPCGKPETHICTPTVTEKLKCIKNNKQRQCKKMQNIVAKVKNRDQFRENH